MKIAKEHHTDARGRTRLIAYMVAFAVVFGALTVPLRGDDAPLAVSVPERDTPVEFGRDIQPILKRNCVACHNRGEAEAGLNLESPESIRIGGDSGPAVVPGSGDESPLFRQAAHREESFMPPEDNDVGARNLSAEELGLLKRWIDEGAQGTAPAAAAKIAWHRLHDRVQPIYAVDITSHGRYVAAARANRISVYRTVSKKMLGQLSDPGLATDEHPSAHLDLVHALAFSDDEQWIASGGFRTIKLWQRQPQSTAWTFGEIEARASGLSVSPAGNWAAVGTDSGDVLLLARPTADERPKVAAVLRGHDSAVLDLCFSADGATLVTAAGDRVRCWNVAEARPIGVIPSQAEVTAVTILADGQQIAAGCKDNVIRLWQMPSITAGQAPALGELRGHTAPVRALCGIGDSRLASASADGTIRIWDVAMRRQVRQLDIGTEVVDLAVTPDGKRLAAVGAQPAGRLWNLEDGALLSELPNNLERREQFEAAVRSARIRSQQWEQSKRDVDQAKKRRDDIRNRIKNAEEELKTSTDDLAKKTEAEAEKQAAKQTAQDSFRTADQGVAAKKKEAAQAEAALEQANDQNRDALTQARNAANTAVQQVTALLAKKKEALDKAVAEADQSVQARTTAERNVAAARGALERNQQVAEKQAVAIGKVEAALEQATVLRDQAHEIRAAKEQLAGEPGPQLIAVAFAPDGQELAVVDRSGDVHTFSAGRGEPLDWIVGSEAVAIGAAYWPSGRLVVADGDAASLRAVATEPTWTLARTIGSAESTALADRVTALDIHPSGTLLAAGGGEPSRSGELKVFALPSGSLVREIDAAHSDAVLGVAFSPDGTQLASCASDRFMKTHDVQSGSLIHTFEGHTGHVLGVSWHATGRTLATCGADNVVKIWDARSGEQRKTIAGFPKELTGIDFLGTEDLIVIGGGDKLVATRKTDGSSGSSYGGSTDFVYTVRASADGTLVVAGGEDGHVRVWAKGGQRLATFAP